MSEPYTDEEKSLARILGVNVQTVRVSKFAQHLDMAFRRKNVVADIKVGHVYSGPNNEPRIEVTLSSDAAVHLANWLNGEEQEDDWADGKTRTADQMKKDLTEVCALVEEWSHQDGRSEFQTCKALHEFLHGKGYIDG